MFILKIAEFFSSLRKYDQDSKIFRDMLDEQLLVLGNCYFTTTNTIPLQ